MKKLDQIDHNIKPSPGYLLAIRYIPKTTGIVSLHQSAKETDGQDQKSTVLAVGESVDDNNGVTRFSPCKKGDIIIHAASMSEFEIGTDKYRFVHFTQVHGIWEDAK